MNEYRGDSPKSAANTLDTGSSPTDGISLLEAHDLSARIRAIPIEQLMALQSIIEEGSFDAAADVMH
ncbi:hypothetical protein, partial [Bifidobacterium crudilactis]